MKIRRKYAVLGGFGLFSFAYVDALKKAGFNLLCLTNNHIMDRGEQGILNTLENCRELGVDTVGAFKTANERNKIYVKNIGGIKVAFLNYTYGTNAFAHHRYLEHKYMVNLSQPEECKEGSVANNPPLSKNERINRVTTALSISRIFGSVFPAISREGIFISKTVIFLLIFISKPST